MTYDYVPACPKAPINARRFAQPIRSQHSISSSLTKIPYITTSAVRGVLNTSYTLHTLTWGVAPSVTWTWRWQIVASKSPIQVRMCVRRRPTMFLFIVRRRLWDGPHLESRYQRQISLSLTINIHGACDLERKVSGSDKKLKWKFIQIKDTPVNNINYPNGI